MGNGELNLEEKYQLFKKFSKKYKEEGDYYHNFFLADLLPLYSDHHMITPKEVMEHWNSLTEDDDFLSLYIHTPFCIKKCDYCIYSSDKLENREQLDQVLEDLIKEIEYYGKRIDKKFNTLYFGGGTPSIFSAENIEKILEKVHEYFSFKEGGLKNFEINPVTCNTDKLDALVNNGINRVSFGVQSMQPEVLENVNRSYQKPEIVKKIVKEAVERDFRAVNVDLIIGLEGSSTEKFVDTFKQVIKLKPDTISTYPLQPKKEELQKRGINDQEFFEMIEKMLEKVRGQTKEIAEEHGYLPPKNTPNPGDANSWAFFKNDYVDNMFKYSYFGKNKKIDAILGMGIYQHSFVKESVKYRREGFSDFKEDRKIYHSITYDKKNSMREYILDKFAEQKFIKLDSFSEKFGEEAEKEFKKSFEDMASLDLIERQDGKIILKTETPFESFVACHFLFDKESIKHQIKEEALRLDWEDFKEEVEKL